MKLLEIYDEIKKTRKSMEFLRTGFDELDKKLRGGFLRKELVVVGGFTGTGKSFLAGQMLLNIAKQGFKTAFISLEISNSTVMARLVGQEANVHPIDIMTNNLSQQDRKRTTGAIGKMSAYNEYIDSYDNIYDLADILKVIRKGNFDFVVVDFIQNVMIQGTTEYERMSRVSLELQRVAKEKNCCVLVLSQVSNATAKDKGNSQLEYKGSGAIAMVCDLGFFLVSDFDEMGTVKLLLKKNRRGESGNWFELMFTGKGGKLKPSWTNNR